MPVLNKPALSFGGPLEPGHFSGTLAQILERAAAFPHQGIIHIEHDGSEQFHSYEALRQDALRIVKGLYQLGLRPGDKAIFQLTRSQDFLSALWACFLGGIIPVPIAIAPSYDLQNSVVKKIHNVWEMLEQPLVISDAALASQLEGLADEVGLRRFRVEQVDYLVDQGSEPALPQCDPQAPALLLLTSGSTGLPKGVVLNHQNLLAMTAGTTRMNGFTRDEVSLNWMPLDHVGSIVFLGILAVDLSCTQIHVPTDAILRRPLKWLELIQRHRATISWAPNFAFSLINQNAEALDRFQYDLSSMKFLVNAGEQVAFKTVHRFLELLEQHQLPPNALRPAFGMSETCSGITWSLGLTKEDLSEEHSYISLGPPIPGASLRITDQEDNVLPEGEIGLLQVRGPSVTPGYYHNIEKNREVFREEGWFVTGDQGYLEQGQLVITGREKQDIIVNGINYPAHELETAVEEVAGVTISYTCAFAVHDPEKEADLLVIVFVPESTFQSDQSDWPDLIRRIRRHLVQHVGVAPAYILPLKPDDIPKTSIGKIQRSQLKSDFEQGAFAALIQDINGLMAASRPQASSPSSQLEQQISEIWQAVLNLPEVNVHENFFELGGHSVLLVQVHSKLEALAGRSLQLVNLFQYPTVSALAKYLSQAESDPSSSRMGQSRAKIRTGRQAGEASSDIAVIGMACRFPGADSLDQFWHNLREGVESVTFFSEQDIQTAGIDPQLAEHPQYVKASPTLKDVEGFDAAFFGYSAKEAEMMDPQHRLFLECTWEAMESAGYNPWAYEGSVGLYAGASMNTLLTQ